MLLGLRVLFFKLSFFKVKRILEVEKLDSVLRKRSNIEFLEIFERGVKK